MSAEHGPAGTATGVMPRTTDVAADGVDLGHVRRVGLAAGGLTIAVTLGHLVTVGREMFVAAQAGTTPRLDAVLVALVAPLTIGGLLQSGTAAALVAAVGAVQAQDGRASAQRLAGAVLTWTTLVGVALTLAVILLARPFISLVGPGLAPAERDLATAVIPLVAPIIALSALAYVVAALCQLAERFRPIAIAAVVTPVVAAAVTIALWPALDVSALAAGMALAASANLAIVAHGAARAGVLPRPTLRARWPHTIGFLRHAAPLWASSLGLSLNLATDRGVASLLGPGAVSALRYGETVMRLPTGAVADSWGTVVYPALVRSELDPAVSLGPTAGTYIRGVVALAMPVTVGVAALAPLVVAVAFQRGEFGADDVRTTAPVVAALAPIFLLSMVQAVLVGAHNARRAGLVLLAGGILNAALNLVLNVLLSIPFGVAGIGLSSSLATLIVLAMMAVILMRYEPGFRIAPIARVGGLALVASLVPGLPIGVLAWSTGSTGSFAADLGLLLAGAALGALGFVVVARLLGIDDVIAVVQAATARARGLIGRRGAS